MTPEVPAADLFSTPDPNGPRQLQVIKSNLGPMPPPLRLVLEEHADPPILRYSSVEEEPPPPTMLSLCAEWLLGYLAAAGEPVQPAEVIAAAKGAGFAQATLYRARKALGGAVVEVGRGAYDPTKKWGLAAAAGQSAPEHGGP